MANEVLIDDTRDAQPKATHNRNMPKYAHTRGDPSRPRSCFITPSERGLSGVSFWGWISRFWYPFLLID